MNRPGVRRPCRGAAPGRLLVLAVGLALLTILAIVLGRGILRRPPQPAASARAPAGQDSAAIRERNAETLFRSAQAAIAAGNWPLARDELARLKDDWSSARFYAAHRAEVEALAKAVQHVRSPNSLPPPPLPEPPPPGKADYVTVFIGPKGPPEPPIPDPEDAPEAWRKHMAGVMGKTVTFDFFETPCQDAANFLMSLVDITIILDPKGVEKLPTITLRVEEMPFQRAFAQVCKQAGLAQAEADGAILLGTEARLKEIAEQGQALRPALKPPTKELAEKAAKKVTFDFVETPLEDVLTFLSSLVDLAIVLDPKFAKDNPTLTLRVNEMRLDRSLRWIGLLTGCGMAWREGALFVSTPEHIKAGLAEDEALHPAQQPPTKELAEKLAEKVRFDFVETPWQDVVDFLTDLTKLPLVLDAEAAKDPPNLTLRVFDMPADAAIRWCCRVSGLACVWRGEKLFITTPQRALEEAARRKGQ